MNIDRFENELIRIEHEIEAVARECCSEKESGPTWQSLNRATVEMRNAISSLWRMR